MRMRPRYGKRRASLNPLVVVAWYGRTHHATMPPCHRHATIGDRRVDEVLQYLGALEGLLPFQSLAGGRFSLPSRVRELVLFALLHASL